MKQVMVSRSHGQYLHKDLHGPWYIFKGIRPFRN